MKVVMTDTCWPELEVIEKAVAETGGEFKLLGWPPSEEEVAKEARDATVVVSFRIRISRSVIEQMEKCQLMIRAGIGYDLIDVEAATERGIYVANVPDYCLDEVSDHALALLLGCIRKVPQFSRRSRAGEWDFEPLAPLRSLRGRRLGIVGLGKIGRRLVPKAKAFGLEVVANDPYLPDDIFQLMGVDRYEVLHRMLEDCDYVSCHVCLTPETEGMFGEEEFQAMPDHGIFINTSRGQVVRQDALRKALEEGWIEAAGIDVLEEEPFSPDDPILKFENLVVTPHIGWYSEDSLKDVIRKTAQEIVRGLRGQRPKNAVNPEAKWPNRE